MRTGVNLSDVDVDIDADIARRAPGVDRFYGPAVEKRPDADEDDLRAGEVGTVTPETSAGPKENGGSTGG